MLTYDQAKEFIFRKMKTLLPMRRLGKNERAPEGWVEWMEDGVRYSRPRHTLAKLH